MENGEIPVVVATIAFGMGIDKTNTKKGLSDDAKDIQSKALQIGFGEMIEYCEKAECRHKMMAPFFNESDLKKCLKNCDFCRIPEKVSQQANALKTEEFERRCKARELTNGGVARKARRITHHCFQDAQLHNHKAAQILSATKNATKNGTEYDSSSASVS
ncbi:hypothetical protein WR25_05762 [Diploscapter pachys]|uniref:ATP-dependent DNA helicase RecQ zinc-binding domain-containing protein n=1 Tax=Diploscapter pachys TaxID=2018661 RepID=A0A2A2JND2_9BILA|nr:hypothetical protein WR25_05762 [Diploscapter pachys]